jgi:iron complex transport system permease protein
MKVTLDLDDLVARGELDAAEAERLRRFAVADTSALGINVFLALGAVAISLGLAALIPTALTAVAIGVVLVAAGLALTLMRESRWSLFVQVCLTIGALALSGGLSFLAGGALWANLAIALGVAAVATVARSGLLVAIAVIAFAASVGAATNYEDSLFWQPALSIALLAVITLVLFVVSLRLSPAYERLAIIGARVAIVMLNVGFLIGSLLGDSVLNLPPVAFSVAWAVVLLGAAIWAMRAGRRWVVNAVAVFGAMHFFIQWFMVLGATALSIIGGGILLIGLGFTLAAFNRRRGAAQPA